MYTKVCSVTLHMPTNNDPICNFFIHPPSTFKKLFIMENLTHTQQAGSSIGTLTDAPLGSTVNNLLSFLCPL